MAKVYDAVVTTTYEQGGETKKRYINVGAVFSSDRGMSLKLDAIPVNFNGWIAFYEPKPREAGQQNGAQNGQRHEDDDLPRF
jgi:hypothetical protein